jgi:NAD(P)-dependent dehydrogenase (short-subunit alcohol dehydrogenase family)
MAAYRSILIPRSKTAVHLRINLGRGAGLMVSCRAYETNRRKAHRQYRLRRRAVAGVVPYGKGSVCYLSETVAQEVAAHGFGMTILCPGFVPTNIADNSARLRGGKPADDSRTFEPVPTPMLDRFRSLAMDNAEAVGVMVRNAILANTLYVHTKPLPGDLIIDRLHAQFGSATTGNEQ